MTLVANILNQSPENTRKFHLNSNDEERALNDYLLNRSLPRLIIKIIGTNHQRKRHAIRASIQNAFELVLHNLMQQTRELICYCGENSYSLIVDIWLFNGTRAMIDLEDEEQIWKEFEQENPCMVTCEVLFIER